MNKILRDKRGGEKLLSVWWFFILLIVGGGIVVGVIIHFGAEVNIKGLEAEILNDKVMDCIGEGSFLIEEVFQKDFDILKECGLSSEVFEQGSVFYINLTISKGGKVENSFVRGDGSLERDCPISISNEVRAGNFPGCMRVFRVFSGGEEVRLLTASMNLGEKIPVNDGSFGEVNVA
jgi:hypothetical protein